MITKVGYAAGEIWHLLNSENGQAVTKIKNALKADYPDLVTSLALGWLLRENKIDIVEEVVKGKTSTKVILK
ncbi:MAG: winged helix-turn-helix domain-containing protein [Candidatus Wallbacteria bacterium]|nr:winged helix-turn-helix domain-containing protein [Candidatus Wallbacteria bacterium]